MSGFLSLGNNTRKHAFLTRSGSYSTHGSRKGFVDAPINEKYLSEILTTYREERRILGQRNLSLSKQSRDLKIKLGLNPEKTTSYYLEKNKLKPVYDKRFNEDLMMLGSLAEQLQQIQKRIKFLNDNCPKDFENTFINILREELPRDEFLRLKKKAWDRIEQELKILELEREYSNGQ